MLISIISEDDMGLHFFATNCQGKVLERRSSNGKLTTLKKEWLAQGK